MNKKKQRLTAADEQARAERFVRLWQTSQTLEEAARRVGTTKHKASSLATYYRNKGVPMKRFTQQGRKSLLYGALATLARSLVNGKE